MHCSSHCLNLTTAKSFALCTLHSIIDHLQQQRRKIIFNRGAPISRARRACVKINTIIIIKHRDYRGAPAPGAPVVPTPLYSTVVGIFLNNPKAMDNNATVASILQRVHRNRKIIAIPLLDHARLMLESNFSNTALVSLSVIGIVPSICCTREVNLDDALVTYADGLLLEELFVPELCRWKHSF